MGNAQTPRRASRQRRGALRAALAAWLAIGMGAGRVLAQEAQADPPQAGPEDQTALPDDRGTQPDEHGDHPAPERPPEQTNPMEVARQHMERGQSLYQAERYIESAEEFLRAYEAQPFAAFLFNAGIAYEKVGDPGRAADYFGRYLRAAPQADDAAEVKARIARLKSVLQARQAAEAAEAAAKAAEAAGAQAPGAADAQAQQAAVAAVASAKAELEAARQRVAELEAQLAEQKSRARDFKSLLSVQTQPEDATITIKDSGGQLVGKGTGPEYAETLVQGKYTLTVEHPDYKTISTPIHVAPGKVYVVITEMSQGQFLGFLRVVTDVPGARVFMDNKEEGKLGETPFQSAVSTGVHHIWIDKPGYKVVERDVEVGIGDEVTVRLELERVDYGRVRVVANRRDAAVFIDGQRKGLVPLELDVPHGAHTVTVSAPNMKDWEQEIVVRRGQLTPVRVRLRPAVGRAGAYVTAVVSALLVGGGVTASVMGKNLRDDLNRSRSQGLLVEDDPRILRGKLLYIGADAGYGLGVLFAGLATYYFLRDPLPDSEAKVLEPRDWTFNPYVGPGRAGAQLGWSF